MITDHFFDRFVLLGKKCFLGENPSLETIISEKSENVYGQQQKILERFSRILVCCLYETTKFIILRKCCNLQKCPDLFGKHYPRHLK